MGKGLVDELRREFDIQVEWLGFEIHPETPPGGLPITDILPKERGDLMFRHINTMGAPYGIAFAEMEVLPNSKMALEASEFARENGKFDDFHQEVFHSFFSEGRDIGQIDVLAELAQNVGLDGDRLKEVLREKRYEATLEHVKREAIKKGITGAPTFVIEGKNRIVGAQSIDVFRDVLREI